jgi:hypothetical protein
MNMHTLHQRNPPPRSLAAKAVSIHPYEFSDIQNGRNICPGHPTESGFHLFFIALKSFYKYVYTNQKHPICTTFTFLFSSEKVY